MALFSDVVVIFVGSIVVLTADGQFVDCAIIIFNEQPDVRVKYCAIDLDS
jgi:hypothetical protein